MFGLTADKLIILAVIGGSLLGPSRLPAAAAWLGRLVRELRRIAEGAKTRAQHELGDDFDDFDWQKLDPRRYDPRRIIVEALQAPAGTSDGAQQPHNRTEGTST